MKRTRSTCLLLFLLSAKCFLLHGLAQTVHVKDHGATPGDGLDDAVAIQNALNYAKANNIKTVLFDTGRYDLLVRANANLNAYFGLTQYNGLTLTGAALSDGTPGTWLVKFNPQENNTVLPAHARFDRCNQLTIKNLAIDNSPQYATAGKVVEKGASNITVEIFDGLPAKDGMGAYCANTWDLSTGLLKQVPSLSFVTDVAAENLYWQHQTTNGKHYMRMNSTRFAQAVDTGAGVSWHFGAQTMFQLALNFCNDLKLENITTTNIAGWGIHTMASKNINATKISFRPNGHQLAVGPRDAWKINMCDGQVVVDSMYVEGVRWDGQNAHSAFLTVAQKLSSTQIRVWKKFTANPPFANDSIGFWNGATVEKGFAQSWQSPYISGDTVYGLLNTSSPLPAFVTTGTRITVYAWDMDHYILKNSIFKKIAGCAGVIKNEKVTLDNVAYDNIMYPAILFGTEVNEATFPQDVLVKNCSFNASGWVQRIGAMGLIGIRNPNAVTSAMTMGTITFDSCTFSNAPTGIDAAGLKGLRITNNQFNCVSLPYKVNTTNTGPVTYTNNLVSCDNNGLITQPSRHSTSGTVQASLTVTGKNASISDRKLKPNSK